MAISFEFQFYYTFLRNPDELDIATVKTEARLDGIEGIPHPRFQIERMEAVKDQKIRNERIVSQTINQLLALHWVLVNEIQNAFEPLGMHLHKELHQFACLTGYRRIRCFVQCMNQLLHASKLPLKLRVDHLPACSVCRSAADA